MPPLTAPTRADRLALFHTHAALAAHLARRLLADPDRAEAFRIRGHDRDDVEQTAMATLWLATASYDSTIGPFTTFGGRCVSRALWDVLSRRQLAVVPVPVAPTVADRNEPDPADVAHVRLLSCVIAQRLDGLSAELRDTLLQFVAGSRQVDIAAAAGVSRQAINRRIERAARQLRGGLEAA
jgi:RNA polymerase sigma factor (sigma-70 family)